MDDERPKEQWSKEKLGDAGESEKYSTSYRSVSESIGSRDPQE
jgi:hypothetical protein